MEIRKLCHSEIGLALALVWEVFLEFEAPDYSPQGIAEFRSFLDKAEAGLNLIYYGAWSDAELTGVLAMRDEHISLLFVRPKYHRRGIAKQLFLTMLQATPGSAITVNSSPYARRVYERLDFIAQAAEQVKNGIRFIPMRCQR